MSEHYKSKIKPLEGLSHNDKATERPRFLGKKYLSQSEVGERYGIPVKTLENWRCIGKGPKHSKLEGSIVRYRLRDLQAWEREAERRNTGDVGGDV